MPVAFSPNHDDDHGGASWRIAFGFGHRYGIGAATSARHHHRRRAHCEPDADAIHHSSGLYLHRPPATVAGKPSHQSSLPDSAAGRTASGAKPVGRAEHSVNPGGSRRELRRVAFLTAVAGTDLAFCNQPILILIAIAGLPPRNCSALQVKFV